MSLFHIFFHAFLLCSVMHKNFNVEYIFMQKLLVNFTINSKEAASNV